MDDLEKLQDHQIIAKLKEYNLPVTPVTPSSRKLLINRLRKAGAGAQVSSNVSVTAKTPQVAASSPARKAKKRSIQPSVSKAPDSEGEEASGRTLTDADIEKTFSEYGWAKPKITDKNRLSLQKKINHQRARSRSLSKSRVSSLVSSTLREHEDDDEQDDSMEVEELEEPEEFEIPTKRTSRRTQNEVLSAPSPKKSKQVSDDQRPAVQSPDIYRFQQPSSSITVVVNPPYPGQHEQLSASAKPQSFVVSNTTPSHIPAGPMGTPFESSTTRQAAARELSPTSSVFVRGQDVSSSQAFGSRAVPSSGFGRTDFSSSSISAPAARNAFDRQEVAASAVPSYERGGSIMSSVRETFKPSTRVGSAYKPTMSQTETDSNIKPKSNGATQTNIADENRAFEADLRARLFGATASTTPRVTQEPIPFSRQTPTPYNPPAKPATPTVVRSVSSLQTPQRHVFVEEQASDPEDSHTPPQSSRLNSTFNSPAGYRFLTPGRTGFSKYIPSFLRSSPRETKLTPVAKPMEMEVSSSEDEEENAEIRRPVRAVRPPVKAEVHRPHTESEVFGSAVWAKYLPHLGFGFFAIIVLFYWQLQNDRKPEGSEGEESIVVTIAFRVIWNLIVIFLIGCGVFGAIKGKNYIVRRHREEEAEVLKTTQRIIDFLIQHAENCKREGRPDDAFVPKVHIRDSLIPVEQRKAKSGLWKKVVEFVEENESRIRKETRDVGGELYEVWKWVPTVNPGMDKREKVWQGSAFNVDEASMNTPPVKSPTPCLKIRHMFDPTVEDPASDWQSQLKDDLLEKCGNAKIVHMALDSTSKDGIVYVKCLTKEDAKDVYKAVHGWWYGGKILVVKYVTLQRYYQRFPMSVSSKDVMRPSSNSARLPRRRGYSNGRSAHED